MITFPNAKINIGLNIVSRRPDGYHDLESIFYPLPWRDVLEIVPGKSLSASLTVTGRGCDCPPEKNLVMKAYRALSEEVGDLPPVDIYLRKIIPDGAGLGGGSADAAFTLKMLNEMFSLGFSETKLAGIAATIGADCPFFIFNRPMLATGTGTTLSPVSLNLSGLTIAVIKPDIHVSTKEAYAGVSPLKPELDLLETVTATAPTLWRGKVKNDFEESIFPSHPSIAQIKQTLYDRGAVYASMSGSGSSVYALFDNAVDARKAAEVFSQADTFVSAMD